MSKPSNTNHPKIFYPNKNSYTLLTLIIGMFSFRSLSLRVYGDVCSGVHLFPFRTEKLSPPAQMVLVDSGRVCCCHNYKEVDPQGLTSFLFWESPDDADRIISMSGC